MKGWTLTTKLLALALVLPVGFRSALAWTAPKGECTGVVGNRVWNDLDGDGIQDLGEPGLGGVRLILKNAQGDVIDTDVSRQNGFYRLGGFLCAVTFSVEVDESTLPPGFVPSPCMVGNDPQVDSNCNPYTATFPDDHHRALAVDFGYTESFPCAECDGKVTALTMRYLGANEAFIDVETKKNGFVFSGTVMPQATFSFVGNDKKGTLGTEIKVFVDGVLAEEIHTSCSQPIAPGLVFGDFEVVSGESRNGGLLCPLGPCDESKPCKLTMRYTGHGCEATSHSQDPGKVECAGDPSFAANVVIRASDKSDPDSDKAKVWFEGEVGLGDLFCIESLAAGEDDLKSSTYVHVFDMAGTLLQEVEFHTSCSQPLDIGDQFGGVRLEGFTSEGHCANPPGGGSDDLCESGKPRAVTMRYTGQDCAASSHSQDDGKASCSGDPLHEPVVLIVASDKEEADDDKATLWFTGSVPLNDTFVIDAGNGGRDRLKSNTYVHVFDLDRNLLQTVQFHTSCSAPLALGDQFGSLVLTGFVPE